jgi:hypothetical protein
MLVVGLWSLAFGRWPLVVGPSPQDSVSIFFACFAIPLRCLRLRAFDRKGRQGIRKVSIVNQKRIQ